MDTSTSVSLKRSSFNWSFLGITLALTSGLALSVISGQNLCSESCSATKEYLFFGLPFAYVGIAFFSAALLLYFVSYFYTPAAKLTGWMIAGALGAEIRFIYLQKYEIGHWCPICLSIAAAVGVAFMFFFCRYLKTMRAAFQRRKPGEIMQKIKTGFTSFSFILLGLIGAILGITKINEAQAAVNDIKSQIVFGNKRSPIEIYFVSDWFCPSCKKAEPEMEKIYAEVKAKTAFYFIDFPIHQKSLNYTPYNLAFLVNNKTNYLQARQALQELAKKNETPNDQDIMRAVKKQGITLKELNFVQVKAGMSFFDSIVSEYAIKSTPTLIVTNRDSKQTVKLEGRNEISQNNVLKAIAQVQSRKS